MKEKTTQKLLRRVNRQTLVPSGPCPAPGSTPVESSPTPWQRRAMLQQQHFTSVLSCSAELGVTMAATSAVGSGGRT